MLFWEKVQKVVFELLEFKLGNHPKGILVTPDPVI